MSSVLAVKPKTEYMQMSASKPGLPPKRRLSRHYWERVWTIQFEHPLSEPYSIHGFAEKWSTDNVQFKFQLRTPSRICVVFRTTEMADDELLALSMELFAKMEKSIGHIERIEDKPAAIWMSSE